ncbi:type I restriction enzyme HsdR N-terminal domain-containing protein [Aurantibacillus circumpalustris]|uniref:type I restriction enzyme HsdR N-terminal domain-containing protein n=1 Tax=Aurantibacillus circumpalustris TaxID=3036359 RepID=UPI00295B8C0A|nr:type I restriction enzyme HsdR N-terminal domain-containing protein [Aurantibacillus circumpalustris]
MRLKKRGEQTLIFDFIRKKWLVLSPEEWVRQHVLNYLVTEKNYTASNISIEKELVLNGVKKRYDVVVYSRDLKPYLIIECKAPYIELDQLVIEQAQRYNLIVKAQLLMITNGVSDLVFNISNQVVDLPNQVFI